MENKEYGNRDPKGYYAFLGVSPDATADELRKAYDSTINRYYVNGDDRAAIEMVKQIYWLTLQPDAARSKYDCGYKSAQKQKQDLLLHYYSRPCGHGDFTDVFKTPPPKSWWEKLID